jgi:hypothetical protein
MTNSLAECAISSANATDRASGATWQERRDSNPQPPVLETGALAN